MKLRIVPLCGLLAVATVVSPLCAETSQPASDSSTDVIPSSAPQVATDPNHVLAPQDILRVQVFEEDDINRQCDALDVSHDLTLTLPLIGTISVKGKTIGQVQELIRKLYDKDYLVNPQVNVVVLKYAERSVNVVGSVTKQGRIDFPNQRDLSIVDAIALAGGQTRLADLKHVKLTRINAKGETEVNEVDVDAMMKREGAETVMLQPGDVIYVPERML